MVLAQAMLYATGLTEDDLNKAQVGVCSVWFDGNPCNMHLLDLGTKVRASVKAAGLVGYRFNTVGVSDGISMGTTGMRYSLQSRDVIADSIETVMGGQWYDGLVAIPGCDKNMPGTFTEPNSSIIDISKTALIFFNAWMNDAFCTAL